MALMYPWATKEYILWNMTMGQLILYYNLGMDIRYPSKEKDSSIANMSPSEISKLKKELHETYGEIS